MGEATTVVGYCRVSDADQNDTLQRDALDRWAKANGVDVTFFSDTFTGKTMDRPGWTKLWRMVIAGKVEKIIVWKLDRIGRTAAGLAKLFEELLERGVGFHSLTESIDLETPSGRLMAHILSSVGAYETEIRSERQRAGIAAVRRRNGGRCPWGGSQAGTPKKLTREQVAFIRRAKAEGQAIAAIARTIGCGRQTVYRVLSWPNDENAASR